MYLETAAPTYRTSIFNSLVAPRPIGWISTRARSGDVNLAPFSYFNGLSAAPPMVMFACNEPEDRHEKDTVRNARETGEFCVNITSYALREEMNATSETVDYGIDEFELAHLEKASCRIISAPRVLLAPASLECRVRQIVDLAAENAGERRSTVVIGRVVALHVRDEYLGTDGRFDVLKAQPLARLGGFQYLRPTQLFELIRPSK